MINRIIVILSILFVQVVTAQQKTRADRFFEKGDYINAALYYEEELKKEQSKKALENISLAYYNTFEYRKAARYLKQLINGKFSENDKSYDNIYNFKLYQTLSALGEYDTAINYLKRFKANNNIEINTDEAIETIETFKLKNPDYIIEKSQFNSTASEFGAVKFGDSVYFTSDRETKSLFGKTYKWTHQSFLDIYAVKVNEDLGVVSEVKPMPKPINSKLHEGNFCFTKDGNTIYISKSNVLDGKKQFDDNDNNNIHLYKSIFSDGKWSELEKLPFNTDGFSYQHPALSPDGSKLYFSSNREGGFGNFDLYYVDIKPSEYSEPINLGATINTENREHFPFISDKGHLFFASNGHLGLGMLDNFVSEFIEGKFESPVNLGVPINSPYDDFNLIYHNSQEGFFASNRNRRNDDIFLFEQTGEIFIREYINNFEIRDAETKALIPNTEVELLDKNTEVLYNNTLGETASFSKNLLEGNYILRAKNEDYISNVLNVKVLEKQDQQHVLFLKKLPPPPPPPPVDPVDIIIAEKGIDKELEEKDPERFKLLTDPEGPPVVEKDGKLFFELKPIYFDFDMWNIRQDSKVILDELASKLERYPNVHLKISSHTDSRGTARYNQILSERRAESTRNYLALEGYINARRLQFEGFGELQPIVSCPLNNCTDEEHQLNRRSEFEIIEYKKEE
ncbi:OmpA family protein [Winogradskyella luteola]|uniref:PD40 domain-containing protein n=1 Tax=Winogradskyella luteola TaxID=2828330 RepID=A0A9X1FAG2_9FLAO|nr:OmpA family protein [Winogradskyella luteola]MBV7270271.1 PD40 domain-containing protein [Winogradskyella luteola]